MKKIIATLFLIAFALTTKAQKDTLQLIQVYTSFNDYEKTEWTSFMNDWSFFEYSGLLKSQNIKNISCKSCANLYADVYLEIDANGTIKKAIVKNGKKCDENITDKAILDWYVKSIKKRKFVSLSSKKFIARFGQVLKC